MLAPPTVRPSAPTSLSSPELPTTLIRKPPIVKRRSTAKRSIDESSSMVIPSSPSKRMRVTFDSDVEFISADEDGDLDPLVIKEQVRRAIERHRVRDDEAYDRIRAIFTVPADSPNMPSTKTLKAHLQALLANVTGLTKECSGLVNSILFSEWIGRDDNYYALFVRFLNNLAAAQRGYQNKIMQMLVELLGPQKTRRIANAKPVRQPLIHRRTFQAIQHITLNVPTAPSALADRLAARLEFDFQKAGDRMTYIKNFMELVKYVPELTSEILTNIMRELIKLDVSIQADLDEDGEDAEEELVEHMSLSQTLRTQSSQDADRDVNVNDEDFSTSEDSDMEDDEDIDAETARRRKLKEDMKEVDLMMDILFRYYDKLISSTALQTRHNAIEQLIAQFHSLILPTYRSRHPQFLIFHFAQTDPIIVDRFVTSCIATLMDKKQPQVIRQSAAAYFSGFVGRGANVPIDVVRDCMDLLCEQLTALRKTYEPICLGPDVKRFGDFYAIFQAILYIFCFRWRDTASPTSDLDDDDSDIDDDENIPEQFHFSELFREAVHTAVYSPLNPLRVCTPVIVDQFAKLAYALQLFYIFPKIEENKLVRLTTQWRTTSAGGSLADLTISQPDRDLSWLGDNGMIEGFFPYDPYHLPISRHWIEDDYVDWKGIPGETLDEMDSEDEAVGGGVDLDPGLLSDADDD